MGIKGGRVPGPFACKVFSSAVATLLTTISILLPIVLAAEFRYCGKHQVVKAGDVNIETNQWNNDNNLLAQCVNVDYDKVRGTVSWDVEWQQPQKTIMPLAYPNLQAVNGLPVRLRDVVYLNAITSWTYQVVDAPEDAEMLSAAVRTNVAFDMFFDLDSKQARDTSKASFEVMIWFGQWGRVVPLGYDSGPPFAEITLEGVDWWVYKAPNVMGQTVITFLPKNGKRSPEVNWQIMDFLREVQRILPDEFVPMLWLGHLQVGSELFEATKKIKLSFTDTKILIGASADAEKPPKGEDNTDETSSTTKPNNVAKPQPTSTTLATFAPPDLPGVPREETASGQNVTVTSTLGLIKVDPSAIAPPNATNVIVNGGRTSSLKSDATSSMAVLSMGFVSTMAALVFGFTML